MTKKVKLDVEKIHMISIIPVNFSINNDKENPACIEHSDFSFSFGSEVAYNRTDKLFKIILTVAIILDSNEEWDGNAYANLQYEFIYEVENFEDFYEETENEVNLDSGLVTTLAGLSYSTLRGIVYSKGSGSIIENAIFPVVNPGNLLTGE